MRERERERRERERERGGEGERGREREIGQVSPDIGHQETQRRDHTRNDHDIKEPEENEKKAEARPRATDYTLRQAA